jgi:hypothetical protein
MSNGSYLTKQWIVSKKTNIQMSKQTSLYMSYVDYIPNSFFKGPIVNWVSERHSHFLLNGNWL